jgi:hypothetical protein
MDIRKEFERVLALAIEDAYRVAFKEPRPDPVENSAFLRLIVGSMSVHAGKDGSFGVVLRSSFVKNGSLHLAADGTWATVDLEGTKDRRAFIVSAKEAERIARQMVGGEPRPDATKVVAGFAKKLAKRKVDAALAETQEDALPPPPGEYPSWDDYVRHGFELNEEEAAATNLFCGKHSGFRECCIRFFNGEWQRATGMQRDAWRHKTDKIYGGKAGYIVCPECVEEGRRLVRVKRCACDDAFFAASRKWQSALKKALAAYRKKPDEEALRRAIELAKKERAEALAKLR